MYSDNLIVLKCFSYTIVAFQLILIILLNPTAINWIKLIITLILFIYFFIWIDAINFTLLIHCLYSFQFTVTETKFIDEMYDQYLAMLLATYIIWM